MTQPSSTDIYAMDNFTLLVAAVEAVGGFVTIEGDPEAAAVGKILTAWQQDGMTHVKVKPDPEASS